MGNATAGPLGCVKARERATRWLSTARQSTARTALARDAKLSPLAREPDQRAGSTKLRNIRSELGEQLPSLAKACQSSKADERLRGLPDRRFWGGLRPLAPCAGAYRSRGACEAPCGALATPVAAELRH